MRMGVRGLLVAAMCAAVGLSLEGRAAWRRCRAAVPARLAALRGDALRRSTRGVPPRGRRRDDPALRLRARIGVVKTALLVGEFEEAQREAASLRDDSPRQPRGHRRARRRAVVGRPVRRSPSASSATRWPSRPRCRAAATAWPRRWRRARSSTTALNEVQAALRTAPRDGELHHTAGSILERLRRYDQAAAAYTNYVNLLPNKDRSDKALWSKAQIKLPAGVQGAAPPTRSTPNSRRPAAHRRLQAGAGQGDREGPGQQRTLGRLRPRHRLRADDDFAAGGPVGRASRRSPTPSAPASARSACAACSWPGSTRSRSAPSRSTTCRC